MYNAWMYTAIKRGFVQHRISLVHQGICNPRYLAGLIVKLRPTVGEVLKRGLTHRDIEAPRGGWMDWKAEAHKDTKTCGAVERGLVDLDKGDYEETQQ